MLSSAGGWRGTIQRLGPQDVISLLLGSLCVLAALDLWSQYGSNISDHYHLHYISGSKHSSRNWGVGFHVEDLRLKLLHTSHGLFDLQRYLSQSLTSLHHSSLRRDLSQYLISIRKSRFHLHHLEHVDDNTTLTILNHMNETVSLTNISSVYQLYCGNKHTAYFRIGRHDFQTYPPEQCRVFYETSDAYVPIRDLPHTLFRLVPLSNDGLFGFRSITSGYFITAVAPPESCYNCPYKLVIGGPSAGSAEGFRFTDKGYMYSSFANGFVECQEDNTVGIASTQPYSSYEVYTHVVHLKPIASKDLEDALSLVSLSSQLREIYQNHSSLASSTPDTIPYLGGSLKICIAIPMTSKGTEMTSVADSPFWSNFFDSFMTTIDWQANTYVFQIFLGFDKADNLYDTGDAWSELRSEFVKRATFRMSEQLMEGDEIDQVLTYRLKLKLMHFDDLVGAPSQIVSQLITHAYDEGFDYFYQVNDDTSLITSNWASAFIDALAKSPITSNLGVTGPVDSNNEKIFTHSFVHRTHIEVFTLLFQ